MTARRQALVLGAGIAGLVAARVLAEAYEQVVMVDWDRMPADGTHRAGVPQGRHVHAVLPGGAEAFEKLLPGFTAALLADDVPVADAAAEVRHWRDGRRVTLAPCGLRYLLASRPVLERHLRARVLALPNVVLAERTRATGLAFSAGRKRVAGAVVRAAHGVDTTMGADLVVDATGRCSRLPDWLRAAGHPGPREERIGIDLGYASRVYRMPVDGLDGDKIILVPPAPGCPGGGVLTVIEGGRALVTLFGVTGNRPPVDPDGFLDFAAHARYPDIHRVLRTHEPLTRPVAFRYRATVRRRYDLSPGLPAGLLVLGDALCSFNTVYAQGASIAAHEALILRSLLRTHDEVTPGRFFRAARSLVALTWARSASTDLAFPGVTGGVSPALRLFDAYLRGFRAAAEHDVTLAGLRARVTTMVDPPDRILRPRVVARVVATRLRRIPDDGSSEEMGDSEWMGGVDRVGDGHGRDR